MREKLKYVISFIFIGSIVTWFIPMFKVSLLKLSYMGIFKTGLGYYSDSNRKELIYASVRENVSPLSNAIAMIVGLIILEAIIIALISYKLAYTLSIIAVVLNNVLAGILLVLLWGRLEDVIDYAKTQDLTTTLSIDIKMLLIWFIVQVLILIFSVMGSIAPAPQIEEDDDSGWIPDVYLGENKKYEGNRAEASSQQNYSYAKAESKVSSEEDDYPATEILGNRAPVQSIEKETSTLNSENSSRTGYCGGCGQPVSPGSIFCGRCGFKLK